jgi:hypothetical protein
MVVAYHLIWTAYGWWLPNDPRGSSLSHLFSLVFRAASSPRRPAHVARPPVCLDVESGVTAAQQGQQFAVDHLRRPQAAARVGDQRLLELLRFDCQRFWDWQRVSLMSILFGRLVALARLL